MNHIKRGIRQVRHDLIVLEAHLHNYNESGIIDTEAAQVF